MAYKDHTRALEYWKNYNAKRRVVKPPSARQIAIENGDTHYISDKPCVHGHIAPRRVNDRVCTECDSAYQKRVRLASPEKRSIAGKAYYERTKARHLAQKKEYRQANKGSIAALNAARKEQVSRGTPKWLTEDQVWMVKEAYKLSALRSKMLGFQWHVDHVVPLQGKQVSGLHVPWNLQVIPAVDNIRKKNKFEVGNAQ